MNQGLHTTPDDLRQRPSAGGFSMIEVMFGVVVMTVGALSILAMSTRLHNLREIDEEISYALRACRNTMEDIRAMPISQVPALNNVGFDVPGPNRMPGGLRPVNGDPDGLPGRIAVEVDEQTPEATLYRVTVEVIWAGRRAQQSFRMRTLLMDRG